MFTYEHQSKQWWLLIPNAPSQQPLCLDSGAAPSAPLKLISLAPGAVWNKQKQYQFIYRFREIAEHGSDLFARCPTSVKGMKLLPWADTIDSKANIAFR